MRSPRDDVLSLLAGRPIGRLPVFGGLPSLTAPGLKSAGILFSTTHTDPNLMARAAATTFELFGYESAVAPFDLCVEAEALGAGVDFQTGGEGFFAPVVSQPMPVGLLQPGGPELAALAGSGRVPLVAEAIRRLKAGVGRQVAIGAWIPGPFTLSWQLYGADAWLAATVEGDQIGEWLAALAEALAGVGRRYREAGADFLTVHDMGGSPQVVGPRAFRRWVKPALARLCAALPGPVVVSVCGDTNAVVEDLLACGAGALNVDQRNDLARTREIAGRRALLLGNLDPVGVLSEGTPEAVANEVRRIALAGVDAVWPGCDLWPEIPEENFRALMQSARAYGGAASLSSAAS
jgi:[methyl-Co(III) methanol-specific corrinoid protein]:coenzyme M methyltransferase